MRVAVSAEATWVRSNGQGSAASAGAANSHEVRHRSNRRSIQLLLVTGCTGECILLLRRTGYIEIRDGRTLAMRRRQLPAGEAPLQNAA
ncbi:hypothetical protein GCM10027084_23730 [Pseudoxanthomonas sangjuensis]